MVRDVTFSEIIHNTLHAKRYRVKRYVRVPAKFSRDYKGRFTGLLRKAYSRRLYDRKAPMVSNIQLMVENITTNNSLLERLKSRGTLRAEA